MDSREQYEHFNDIKVMLMKILEKHNVELNPETGELVDKK